MSDTKKENSPAPGTDPEEYTPEQEEIIKNLREEMAKTQKDIFKDLDKKIQDAGGGADIFKALSDATVASQQLLQKAVNQVSPFLKGISEAAVKTIADFSNYVAAADNFVTDFCGSDKMKELEAIFPDAAEWIKTTKEERPGGVIYLSTVLKAMSENMPAIRDFVREQDFRGSMAEFMEDRKDPETGEMLESIFDKCLLNAPGDKEAAEKATETYPLLSPTAVLSNYSVLTDKAANELLKGMSKTAKRDIDGQIRFLWGVDQSGKSTPKQVPILLSLSYRGTPIETSKYLTADDMAVFESLCTLILKLRMQGELYPYRITPDEIWRIMNGVTNDRKSPTDKQREAVCASMDKMRFTGLYMDLTQELNAHYLDKLEDDRVQDGGVDTYFINADYGHAQTVKGKSVYAYRINEEPFFLTYNLAKGHVIFVDYSLLDTSDTTGNEGYTVAFRRYLLQQISLMYRKERDNTNILYSTIYQDTGIATPEERVKGEYKNKASRDTAVKKLTAADRKKIAAILDSWVNKKWINGYEQTRSGRAYKGVNIILNPANFTEDKLQPIKNIAGQIEQKDPEREQPKKKRGSHKKQA